MENKSFSEFRQEAPTIKINVFSKWQKFVVKIHGTQIYKLIIALTWI